MFLLDSSNFSEMEKYGLVWDEKNKVSFFNKGQVKVFGKINDGDYVIVDSNKSYVGFNINSIKTKNVCLIASRKAKLDCDLPIIRAENLTQFVDDVMSEKRLAYSGQLVAITGSVGKTSTTKLVKDSLDIYGSTLLSIKHNMRNGIYSKLNSISKQQFAIFEVSASAVENSSRCFKISSSCFINSW